MEVWIDRVSTFLGNSEFRQNFHFWINYSFKKLKQTNEVAMLNLPLRDTDACLAKMDAFCF